MSGTRASRVVGVLCRTALAALVCVVVWVQTAGGQTGTFIDRRAATDVRVVSFNVFNDTIFPNVNPTQAAKFTRLMTALDPDVVNLQEIYQHSAAQVAGLMDSILPLGAGATWHAHKSSDNVIVSKYPLSLTATNTTPASPRGIAIALVELPDDLYATDFYFMNNHYRCCGTPDGPEVAERQRQSDALVNWMRIARTPGGAVTLAENTPMAVVGDLNMVESLVPLATLLSGTIVNQETYGSDSPPDWDGSALADARPLHNVIGPADYTWRNDHSQFAPGRLDFVIYTDSVARVAHQFVLNTVAMSPEELAATGLASLDIALTAATYDHLPLVVDFRFVADGAPGDFNLDRVVDGQDYELWRSTFASTTVLEADGTGSGQVTAADYVLWRKSLNLNTAAALGDPAQVPEPVSHLLLLTLGSAVLRLRLR